MDTQDQLLTTFKEFINDINNIIPSTGGEFKKEYQEILDMEVLDSKDCEIINKFMSVIGDHIDDILNENKDTLKIEFLKGLNLYELIDINKEKEYIEVNIWKYLQTFALISINLNSSIELQKLLSGEKIKSKRKDVNDLKKMKSLKEKISQNDNELKDKDKDKDEVINSFENILENSEIGTFAKEIAESLDPSSLFGGINPEESNPDEIMKHMMNPENMMNMFSSINKIVNDKMNDSSVNQNSMEKEAQQLFSNNPMANQMKESMNNTNSNPTKERLRKKLKNKQQNTNNHS